MRLVQMPSGLIHIEDADLDALGIDARLLAAFRAYLPDCLHDRRGVAILAEEGQGGRAMLMVLARRIGAALRDDNIRLRERGDDLKAGRKKLCYLPGSALAAAIASPAARQALTEEAACFLQDLDGAWTADAQTPLTISALRDMLDARLAADRPTFVNAAPNLLPPEIERGLRARLRILEPGVA